MRARSSLDTQPEGDSVLYRSCELRGVRARCRKQAHMCSGIYSHSGASRPQASLLPFVQQSPPAAPWEAPSLFPTSIWSLWPPTMTTPCTNILLGPRGRGESQVRLGREEALGFLPSPSW